MGLTRISDVSRWTACEAWAMTGQDVGSGRKPVAAWVGTMAHRFLADDGFSTQGTELPSRSQVAFDSVTPLPSVAISQACDLAIEAHKLLTRYGLTIFQSEVPVEDAFHRGVIDLLVLDQKNRAGVLDFKTGKTIGSAWLQLAGYLSIYEGAPLSFAGIVHVPRSKLEPAGTITFRDPADLVSAWQRTIGRVAEVVISAEPTYSPGTHCSRCPLEGCAVRMEKS